MPDSGKARVTIMISRGFTASPSRWACRIVLSWWACSALSSRPKQPIIHRASITAHTSWNGGARLPCNRGPPCIALAGWTLSER
eukprot:scaffold74902_cov78-Phaeocystis_antarctica.AAC.1